MSTAAAQEKYEYSQLPAGEQAGLARNRLLGLEREHAALVVAEVAGDPPAADAKEKLEEKMAALHAFIERLGGGTK